MLTKKCDLCKIWFVKSKLAKSLLKVRKSVESFLTELDKCNFEQIFLVRTSNAIFVITHLKEVLRYFL